MIAMALFVSFILVLLIGVFDTLIKDNDEYPWEHGLHVYDKKFLRNWLYFTYSSYVLLSFMLVLYWQ